MRTVEEIEKTARPGAFSGFDIEVALPYLRALKPKQTYLEVGVDKGRSLQIAREETNPKVTVVGVDIRDNPQVEKTIFLKEDSRTAKFENNIDLIFIDGDHSYEGCKADIENWYPQMSKNGVMMFHDCDETSPGVVRAVDEFADKINKKAWKSPNQRCSMAVVEL